MKRVTKKDDVSLVKELNKKMNKQDRKKLFKKDGTIDSDQVETVLSSFMPKTEN